MNYTFKITHRNSKFKINDIFTEWVTSNSLFNARKIIEDAYPKEKGYSCEYVNNQNNEIN